MHEQLLHTPPAPSVVSSRASSPRQRAFEYAPSSRSSVQTETPNKKKTRFQVLDAPTAMAAPSSVTSQSPRQRSGHPKSPTRAPAPAMGAPTPTTHPIDTFAKKLREQAMELTELYEMVEKQNAQLEAYEKRVQQQQIQLEQQKKKTRQALQSLQQQQQRAAASLSRRTGSTSSTGTTPATSTTAGSAQLKKTQALQRKLKEAEEEKKKYVLANKRFESALVELQVFQNELRAKQEAQQRRTAGSKTSDDDDAMEAAELQQEQQLYIRVLEEAVHLKATEFQITGHEELLMVLAELRHTIYQQEQDVADKTAAIDALQQQLTDAQDSLRAGEQQWVKERAQLDAYTQSVRKEKMALIDKLQASEQRHTQLQAQAKQLSNTVTDNHTRIATLERELAEARQHVAQADVKVKDIKKSLEDAKQEVAATVAIYQQSQQRNCSLETEIERHQVRVDELQAMQEGLLTAIDAHLAKELTWQQEREQWQTQKANQAMEKDRLQTSVQQLNERAAMLVEENERLRQHLQECKQQAKSLEQEKARAQAAHEENQRRMEELVAANNKAQDDKVRAALATQTQLTDLHEGLAELDSILGASLSTLTTPWSQRRDDRTTQLWPREDGDDEMLDALCLDDLERSCACLARLVAAVTSATTLTRLLDTHLPTQVPWLNRLHDLLDAISQRVQLAEASWKRERRDLLRAVNELQTTATTWQHATETLQVEATEARRKLHECEFDLKERSSSLHSLQQEHNEALQTIALLEQRTNEMDTARQTLERQVSLHEQSTTYQKHQVDEVLRQNKELVALDTQLAAQILEKDAALQRLNEERQALQQQLQSQQERQRLDQQQSSAVHDELDEAAAIIEEQTQRLRQATQLVEDSCRQQQEIERELHDHKEHAEGVVVTLVHLVSQYAALLEALEAPVGSTNGTRLYREELERRDVQRLLQLFPTLVEEYITAVVSTTHAPPTKPLVRRNAPPAPSKARAMSEHPFTKPTEPKQLVRSASSPTHRFQTEENDHKISNVRTAVSPFQQQQKQPLHYPSLHKPEPTHPTPETTDEQLAWIDQAFHTFLV
ncbi:TPA: hypothetical protein N0F65_010475 [Lagenidium giganteum]|uniref:Uncharacterized protein n=1 Tax=Lagenidium giganteum TaxID=4803 RepID=A0AAV2Z9V8_9STRA|nr:TPA: hypothetical protein N0F65_010475 [Lagenidium giganteum]